MTTGFNAHLLTFSKDYRTAGVGLYIQKLLEAIHEQGYPLTLFGTDPKLKIAFPNFTTQLSTLNTKSPITRIFWEQLFCPLALKKHQITCFHSPMHVLPLISSKNCKTIITIHDLANEKFPQFYNTSKQKYLTTMTRASATKADAIIAVSENTKKDLITLYQIPKSKITVIYNGLNIAPQILSKDDTQKIKQKFNINEPYVLFVGTLEPRKNIQGLLEALIYLAKEKKKPYTLVIAGPYGWKGNPIQAKIAEYQNYGRVIQTGYISDSELQVLYQNTAAFVYPSFYEGFGFPVLEAMALGAPVITSKTASLPEVGGDAVLYIDPLNNLDIAEKLDTLINSKTTQQRLKEAGLKQANKFNWQTAAKQTLALYDKT